MWAHAEKKSRMRWIVRFSNNFYGSSNCTLATIVAFLKHTFVMGLQLKIGTHVSNINI